MQCIDRYQFLVAQEGRSRSKSDFHWNDCSSIKLSKNSRPSIGRMREKVFLVTAVFLLLLHVQVGCVETPTLLKRFTTNFVLTSPQEKNAPSGNSNDPTTLLVPPGGSRAGILYFDFDKGFVVHLFSPNTGDSTTMLYDHNHMIPQGTDNPIKASILGLRNMVR